MLVKKFAKLQHLIGYRLWLKFWPKNISNIIDYFILLFEEWNQLVIREIFRRWVEVSEGSHWAWGQKQVGWHLLQWKRCMNGRLFWIMCDGRSEILQFTWQLARNLVMLRFAHLWICWYWRLKNGPILKYTLVNLWICLH